MCEKALTFRAGIYQLPTNKDSSHLSHMFRERDHSRFICENGHSRSLSRLVDSVGYYKFVTVCQGTAFLRET